jgi:hypothetical protein
MGFALSEDAVDPALLRHGATGIYAAAGKAGPRNTVLQVARFSDGRGVQFAVESLVALTAPQRLTRADG